MNIRQVSEEDWENIRHMFWVLMRGLENFAENNSKNSMLFERLDTEAAYRTWNRYFDDGSKDLKPSWERD